MPLLACHTSSCVLPVMPRLSLHASYLPRTLPPLIYLTYPLLATLLATFLACSWLIYLAYPLLALLLAIHLACYAASLRCARTSTPIDARMQLQDPVANACHASPSVLHPKHALTCQPIAARAQLRDPVTNACHASPSVLHPKHALTCQPMAARAQFRDPITAWALSVSELMPALHEWGIEPPCAASAGGGVRPGGAISSASVSTVAGGAQPGSGADVGQGGGGGTGVVADKGNSSNAREAGLDGANNDDDCDNKLVYMTAVGTMNNCLGGASLYVSMDELR